MSDFVFMRCIKYTEVIQLFHLKLVNGIKEVLLICGY